MPAHLFPFSNKTQLALSSLKYIIDMARPARSSDYLLDWLNRNVWIQMQGQPLRPLQWRLEDGMKYTKEVCEIILQLVDQMVTDYTPQADVVGYFSVQVKPSLHNITEYNKRTLLRSIRKVQLYVEQTQPLPYQTNYSAERRVEDLVKQLQRLVRETILKTNIYRCEFEKVREMHLYCLAVIYYLGYFGPDQPRDQRASNKLAQIQQTHVFDSKEFDSKFPR